MKKSLLVFVAALALCPMAMASDIAFYIGPYNPGWYSDEQLAHVDTIIAKTGGLFKDIQKFDDKQLAQFGAWVDTNTNDGEMDIIWLNGTMPSVLYQFPNVNPDGSRAEKWLDGGNMIINVGDWFAYVSYEGGVRSATNGANGAANILDLASGIIVSADGTQLRTTPTGKKYLPSLPAGIETDRPVALAEVRAPWEVAAAFATPGGTDSPTEARADPVVIHNTQTDGYLAIINQDSGSAWLADRGLTTAEFINNWVKNAVGLDGFPARPDPKDGALVTGTWASLGWKAGASVVSHDIYLGESFEDVNAGTGNTFRGNVTTTLFLVGLGMPGDPYPAGLVPGTTYYWRVEEVEADAVTKHTGPVWSFRVPSRKAYEPSPSDGAKFMPTDVKLGWTGGLGSKLHYVFFGDKFDDVNNAAGGTPIGLAAFTPAGPLVLDKTYYWRVDEFDGAARYKGDVWSFTTTIAGLGTAVMQRWENITGTALSGLTSDPRYPSSPTVTETVTRFAWDGPDTDNYGARIYGWLYIPVTGDYTFWLNTDDNGELWLSTDDDPANARVIARETGYTGLNVWNTGEEQSVPITLEGGRRYYIMALWKEGTGGDHCQVAWQGPGIATRTIIPGTNLSPYEPMSANGAAPASGSTGVSDNPLLQWKAGLAAASHDVYFGADANAVRNASKTSAEYKGTRALGSESYAVTGLDWLTTYYWRVDEVNNTNPSSPWVGKVWSFTTADYGVVEDFEAYNDIAAGQPGSNLVYMTWLDGFANPNVNGSTMGYPTGVSLETARVHDGTKAAPLIYNNSTASYSEVERTLPGQNWTGHGIQTLSLWFYGSPTNVAGQLYAKINSVKVPYDGEAANLTRQQWQVWNVDLASVGANLQSVTKLAIGIDTKGATGTLLLDDIRLYASPRELITPVQPDPNGLVAHYPMEGNANDIAGTNNGTLSGGPLFTAGKIGQAIQFDGVDDYVDCGTAPALDIRDTITISCWIKVAAFTKGWEAILAKGDNSYRMSRGPQNGNSIHFGCNGPTGGNLNATAIVTDDNWHHVACVYDGANKLIYIDGSEDARLASTGRIALSTNALWIGNNSGSTARQFGGLVDDVRICSRPLSAAEVAGLAGRTQPFDKAF